MRTLRWIITLGAACAALAGCDKSSETQRREADRAAAEAAKKQSEAVSEADQKTRDAREKADRERNELHATVMREKVDARAKIHDALDGIDKDVAELKVDPTRIRRGDRSQDATMYGNLPPKDFEKLGRALNRRDRLMDDADQIDHVIDHDWPSFKERIDRDLDTKGTVPTMKPGRT